MNEIKTIILLCTMSASLAASAWSNVSPYAFCNGNPIANVDPDGREILGITIKDTYMAIQDIRAMFPGEELKGFRELITLSEDISDGNFIAKITDENKVKALNGINLSDDQRALIDIVCNTINSPTKHYIEYLDLGSVMSEQSSLAVAVNSKFDLSKTIDYYGGIPASYVVSYGNGITAPMKKNTYSVVINSVAREDLLEKTITVGHELFGHGRPYSLGIKEEGQQHINSIRIENLIRRVLGNSDFNNGTKHGPKSVVPNYLSIPEFR